MPGEKSSSSLKLGHLDRVTPGISFFQVFLIELYTASAVGDPNHRVGALQAEDRILAAPSEVIAMAGDAKRLRSRAWWDNPADPGMTAIYLERYLNYGLTREELQSGRPIIGIAQTGSDLAPCNRHHIELASRVRDGIRVAGGMPIEFPVHPIQETGKRPTAALDRNLAYLGLVEMLYGYPIDGVVLMTGCDKTTPAMLMAAATVDLPAIVLSGGPMLDGHFEGKLAGSGTVVWEARRRHAAGEIDYDSFIEMVCRPRRASAIATPWAPPPR